MLVHLFGSFRLWLVGIMVWGFMVRQHHIEAFAVKTDVHFTATRKQMTEGPVCTYRHVPSDLNSLR